MFLVGEALASLTAVSAVLLATSLWHVGAVLPSGHPSCAAMPHAASGAGDSGRVCKLMNFS